MKCILFSCIYAKNAYILVNICINLYEKEEILNNTKHENNTAQNNISYGLW